MYYNTNVHSTIGVKQGYPLAPTLFEFYIDQLEVLIMDSLTKSMHCLRFGNVIAILLFFDDIILMWHTRIGIQQQLDMLGTYYYSHGLEVSLPKIKIMAFNLPKNDLSSIHIT